MLKPNVERMSRLGLALLAEYEGSRLKSYRDSAGLLTIGVGHLITDGDREIWQNRRLASGHYIISQGEMLELLRHDVAKVERAISSRKGEVWRNKHMFDSTCSFLFNLGTGMLKKEWLVAMIEREDMEIMEAKFPLYNKAGGKVIRGLVVRRRAEITWAVKGKRLLVNQIVSRET